jgi:hypothetical protein
MKDRASLLGMTRSNLYMVISFAHKEADKVVILRNRNRIELETSDLRFANTRWLLLQALYPIYTTVLARLLDACP